MHTSKFQFVFIAIFVVFIIVGVVLFATYRGSQNQAALPTVTIWGTFPKDTFTRLVSEINNTLTTPMSVNYVEEPVDSFDKDFIETLARGGGPDAILIPQSMIVRHGDKVVPIPFNLLSERDYRDTYTNQAELYITPSGITGIPFTVDPLVMYWNKDIFTNAGIATYPKYWDELVADGTKINQKDDNSNLRRSALSMGTWTNINHARELLTTLMMQAGNPISIRTQDGIVSALGDSNVFSGSNSSVEALSFYTKFADPRNKEYSWNRSLPTSKSFFLAGSLATYFGFASEIYDIKSKNPNLNFDIAPLPQAKGAKNRVTYGEMYGFSIVRSTKDQVGTYNVITQLVSPLSLKILSDVTYLPPVRRDMLTNGSTDPYLSIFYDSAIISRNFLDAGRDKTNQIFQNMVESITSGQSETYDAVKKANDQFNLSLQNL